NTANVYITIEREDIPAEAPSLTIRLNNSYQEGDIYTINLISQESGEVVYNENGNTKELQVKIDPGNYGLILFAKNYKPVEFPETITLDEKDIAVDLNLETDNFDPFCPTLEISHVENTNGFDLRVIKKNIYELKMTIKTENNEEIPITTPTHYRSLKSTRGTVDDPYYYVWTLGEPVTKQTVQAMTDQVTQNTIVFNFYDTLNPSVAISSYTAVYNQFASEIDRDAKKSVTQSLFEKAPESGGVYGEKTLYTASGETTFYPLMGTRLHLTVKSVSGNDNFLEITIPPIPLKYLFLGHLDNVIFDQESDIFAAANPGIEIQSNDLLKAVVTYYTFSGKAIGTGIQLGFEMADGQYKGSAVLYNPVIDGQRLDLVNNEIAPFLGIPMILNPECEIYGQLIESPELWVYVEEKGDGQEGFRAEKLLVDPVFSDDGVVYIKMNHLTAVGLGSGKMPGTIEEKSVECESCGQGSSCFLGTILGW
ncbi:hypothetical protein MHK_010419, partial [Candidatus Magnetomorum sp. HK-1]